MIRIITKIQRKLGLLTGFHIRVKRFTTSASDSYRLYKLLKHKEINCIIDIGANEGQFVEQLLDYGFKGKVISFEPTIRAHSIISKKSLKHSNWVVAERCAIGDKRQKTEIHVSRNSVFSSILPIVSDQVQNAKSSVVDHVETVQIYTLDEIIGEYIDLRKYNCLLKVDTQGFEYQVLQGATKSIREFVGLAIEIPLFPIYEGVSFDYFTMNDWLRKEGYTPYSFNNEGVNYKTGRVNTIDGIFFKI